MRSKVLFLISILLITVFPYQLVLTGASRGGSDTELDMYEGNEQWLKNYSPPSVDNRQSISHPIREKEEIEQIKYPTMESEKIEDTSSLVDGSPKLLSYTERDPISILYDSGWDAYSFPGTGSEGSPVYY